MDIYFQNGYGKLYEEIEGGTAEIYNYKSSLGEIKHQYIRREIPFDVSGGSRCYDLITPYGYGGPIVLSGNEDGKKDLCIAFEKEFSEYCKENNIVCEFVRFHPVINNAKDFKEIYNPIFMRHTLGTNLKDYYDPIKNEFSKSCRQSVRQALNKGVTYRVTHNPDNIDSFPEIYYSTMKRDNASEFYYFKQSYFDEILRNFKENILYIEALYQDKIISAGLYLICEGIIHIHLAGTLSEYLFSSSSYLLLYAAAIWGKENGCNLIHHGGGITNSLDDSLYLYKKKFAQNTEFDFYVGKKIWDYEKYERFCMHKNVSPDIDFFPAYRSHVR